MIVETIKKQNKIVNEIKDLLLELMKVNCEVIDEISKELGNIRKISKEDK